MKGLSVIESLLADFRYKPDWKFTLYVQRIPTVRWSHPAVDVVTGKVDRLHGVMTIPEALLSDEFVSEVDRARAFFGILRQHLHAHEIHESDEWFTVRGVRPYDPHALKLEGRIDLTPLWDKFNKRSREEPNGQGHGQEERQR